MAFPQRRCPRILRICRNATPPYWPSRCGCAARVAQRSIRLRDLTRTLVSRLPLALNRRLNAVYSRSRARAEIAALHRDGARFVALADRWPIRRALDGLSDPAELRRDVRYQLPEEPAGFRD